MALTISLVLISTRARKTGDEIAAFDDDGELLFQRHGRADLDFDVFGRFVADAEVECFLYVVRDGGVDFIAGAFDRRRRNDAAERNHGDVGRAAADIDNHVSERFVNGNAGADCGENWLFDDVGVFGAGAHCCFDDRATLGRGDGRRHGNQYVRSPNFHLPSALSM